MKFIIYLSVIFILCYGTICFLLFTMQRKILYQPSNQVSSFATKDSFEEIYFTTQDNVDIMGLYKHNKNSKYVLLYFHGNAGNVFDRKDKLNKFFDNGFSVFGLSYRGYGKSNGEPSEKGLYKDAKAAVAILNNKYKIDNKNIIIYGESLGSGVAVQLATENNFKALILEAPYTSILNLGKALYSFVPVSLLLKDKFESINKIKNVKTPILIIHGKEDKTVPVYHGNELFLAANFPKKIILLDGIGHTGFDINYIAGEINKFIDSH